MSILGISKSDFSPPDQRTVPDGGELHEELQQVVELVEEAQTNTRQVAGRVSVQHSDELGQAESEDLLNKFVIDFVFVLHNLTNLTPHGADDTGRVLDTT